MEQEFLFLYSLANTCCLLSFFISAILTGARWYFIVVLIYISLMIIVIEHLLMYLLAMCTSALEKCLFLSSSHFKSQIIWMFCYWVTWVLYIFVILHCYQISDLQISSLWFLLFSSWCLPKNGSFLILMKPSYKMFSGLFCNLKLHWFSSMIAFKSV